MPITEENSEDDTRTERKVKRRREKQRKLAKKLKKMTDAYSRLRRRENENTTEGVTETESQTQSTDTSSIDDLCTDIRGADRACCNTAIRCFNDLQTSMSDLDPTQSRSDIIDTCRSVGLELRHDKLCVKNALSRCNGPARMLLRSRFDNKSRNLYDQFYKQCADPLAKPSLPTVPGKRPTSGGNYRPRITTPNPFGHPHTGSDTSGAVTGGIIAAAVVGSFVLIAILFLIAIYCRRKRITNDSSDSSAGSSHNLYEVKRTPNPFVPQAPPRALSRSESNHYAEIDERFVDPSYKPELPPNYPPAPPRPFVNKGYIAPENDVINATEASIQQPISTVSGLAPPTYLDLTEDSDASYYEQPIERGSAFERSYVHLNRDEASSSGYAQPEVDKNDTTMTETDPNVPDVLLRHTFSGAVENDSARNSTASNKSAPHTYFVLEPTNV